MDIELLCKYCNKKYASQSSRSNHIKRYHKMECNQNVIDNKNSIIKKVIDIENNVIIHSKMNEKKSFNCSRCNKLFKFRQNKWVHEKNCDNNKVEKLEEKNKELETIINKLSTNLESKKHKMKEVDKIKEIDEKKIKELETIINKLSMNPELNENIKLEYKLDDNLCIYCNKKMRRSDNLKRHQRECKENLDKVKIKELETVVNNLFTNLKSNEIIPKLDDNTCIFCNKKLSRADCLKRHQQNCKGNSDKIKELETNEIVPKLDDNICIFCNKKLSRDDSLKRHQQNCEENLNKLKIKELEAKTPKLVEPVNNCTINPLGYEDILPKLTVKEKILLITSMWVKEEPIIELVRFIYTKEIFNNERNTLITNLRSKECFTYQSEINKFTVINKSEHIDTIIDRRRRDIISIYKELLKNNVLKQHEIIKIDEYLDKIENIVNKDYQYSTNETKRMKILYEKHKDEIIYIIYNCKEFMEKRREEITGDIEV